MLRKLLIILVCVTLGLLTAAALVAATYENRFTQMERLLRESAHIPEATRRAKAQEIAARLLRCYERTKYLSFEESSVSYWFNRGTWKARLPWLPRRRTAHVSMAMTADSLRTEISVKGRPLYTLLLKEGLFSEFKRPWNGVPGQWTEYPFDPKNFRLFRGVDYSILCETGMYRQPWIGSNPHHPSWFATEIRERGSWLGSVTVQGETCDLVYVDWGEDPKVERTRHDAFYVNSEGFVVIWDIILYFPRELFEKIVPYRFTDMQVASKYYSKIVTEPIPSKAFLPGKALLEEAKAWQAFTNGESLAELKRLRKALGG